jgi:ABC-type nitrate/sulfonate/bicarbonate transport system substrate-binding protein
MNGLKKALSAALLLPLLIGVTACGSEDGGTRSTTQSGAQLLHVKGATFLTSQSSAPAGLLISRPDIAENAGVNIDWTRTNSADNSLVALIAGEVDFAYVSLQSLLGAVASGEDLVAFVHAGGIATELVLSNKFIAKSGVSPDSPLEDRFRALEGATIASSALGHSHPALLQARMSALGLGKWEDLVEPVTLVDVAAQIEGIRQGRFDGAAWSAGSLTPVVDDGTASVWISAANGDLPEATERPGIVWAAKRSWVDANPDAVAAVRGAYTASVKFMHSNMAEASSALKELLFPDMDEKEWAHAFESTLPVFPPDGVVAKETWDETIDMIVDADSETDYDSFDVDGVVYSPMRGEGW